MTMWRAQLLALSLFAWLLPANAHAAALLSADVSITSTHSSSLDPGYTDFSYNANDLAVPASQPGNGCGNGASPSGSDCSFIFSLTGSGFSFQETCSQNELDCTFPNVTITLTDLKFAGGEILANAVLGEDRSELNGADPGPVGAIQGFTANSVTLTIAAFVTHCNSVLLDTVTFTTRALPTGENVPEPTTFSLLGAGLAGLAWWRRRRTTAA